MAGQVTLGSVALSGLVRPASAPRDDAHRTLPVPAALRPLLPARGLRRGTTVAVGAGPRAASGTTSLVYALIAEASRAGSWCAVVGVPAFGALAAAEMGVALDRLALIPHPGPEWPTVVAALIDGVDVVVLAVPGAVSASVTARLAARARQRGAVLVPYGPWDGADLTLRVTRGHWEGLGPGAGRLRRRKVTILSQGRGAATQPRETTVWMPGFHPLTGPVPLAPLDPLPLHLPPAPPPTTTPAAPSADLLTWPHPNPNPPPHLLARSHLPLATTAFDLLAWPYPHLAAAGAVSDLLAWSHLALASGGGVPVLLGWSNQDLAPDGRVSGLLARSYTSPTDGAPDLSGRSRPAPASSPGSVGDRAAVSFPHTTGDLARGGETPTTSRPSSAPVQIRVAPPVPVPVPSIVERLLAAGRPPATEPGLAPAPVRGWPCAGMAVGPHDPKTVRDGWPGVHHLPARDDALSPRPHLAVAGGGVG